MVNALILMAAIGAVVGSPTMKFNSPLKFGSCKNPPVHPGFQAEKFFHNKWYTWKNSGNFFFGSDGSCSATDSKITGDKIDLLHYQYQPFLKRFVSIQGESDISYTHFQGLRFPVDYQLFERFNFTIPFSVVATDYDSWAVAYFCRKMFLSKLEMSWIMVRDTKASLGDAVLSQIESTLNTIDTRIEDLNTLDNSHCGKDEPHF